jgi:transcriptional regulator with XRE-family HTH domain
VRSSTPGTPKTLLHRQTPAFRRQAAALARRVRGERAARSWTIERAAERFGVEPAHVKRIEAARANPSLAVLTSIAKALGVSVSELLDVGRRR